MEVSPLLSCINAVSCTGYRDALTLSNLVFAPEAQSALPNELSLGQLKEETYKRVMALAKPGAALLSQEMCRIQHNNTCSPLAPRSDQGK